MDVANIPDMCAPDNADGFICPNTEVFGTASIFWGIIGPKRQFALYHGLLWFFLIGALCPLAAWYAWRRWPRSVLRYVHFPVLFGGTGFIPPASAENYVTWAVVAFAFNYVVRRRRPMWWARYNCESLPRLPLVTSVPQNVSDDYFYAAVWVLQMCYPRA